jgi:Domain of unknown function (DUF6456)
MKSKHPTGLVPGDVADLLIRLGRPGARLIRGGSATALQSGNGSSRQSVSATALVAVEDAGYVAWAAQAGDASSETEKGTLTSLGRQTLRRHLATEAGSAGRGRKLRHANSAAGKATHGSTGCQPGALPQSSRSVIEQLARRRDAAGRPLFTETQLSAARRFAADFERGGLQPRVTARWSPVGGARQRRRSAPDAMPDLAPSVAAALQRVRGALAGMAGTFGNLIMDVCGFDRGLEMVETERGWARHTGRVMLAGALDQLALHYGLTLRPRPQSSDILQWGDGSHQPDRPAPQRREVASRP